MAELRELLRRLAELGRALRGRHVSSDRVRQPDAIAFAVRGNLSLLQGRPLRELARRSHFLVLRFDGLDLVLSPPPAARVTLAPPDRADEVALGFALEFADGAPVELRCLAERKGADPVAWLIATDDWQSVPGLHAGGVDVLSRQFTPERFASLVRHRHDPVRALLLDRKALDSLGAGDADRALLEAGLHPAAPCRALSHDDALRLHAAVAAVVRAAAEEAERGGEPAPAEDAPRACPRCGGALRLARLRGGSAPFCPRCQPPRGARPATPRPRAR